MTREFPTPSQILEELANKAIVQIEKLAPAAFTAALEEMIQYHRFLLALNASRTADGQITNYAEVSGGAWRAPHQEWISQYRRLFERAANRIPEDSHFIRTLAYVPIRLMQGTDGVELPSRIVNEIIDLGPMMMYQIQNWRTKRTTVETPIGQAAQPRRASAGSDATAYENFLPEFVGAWESLLGDVRRIYQWRNSATLSHSQRWAVIRGSWPFLWRHLTNTAYCLAIAVWNDDEAGATWCREALVRWPEKLWHGPDGYFAPKQSRLIFPDTLKLEWESALEHVGPIISDHLPLLTPDRLFSCIVRESHQDVILLTASTLIFWNMYKKNISDIGWRHAKLLIALDQDRDQRLGLHKAEFDFRSLFLNFLRLDLAGARWSRDTYGNDLDKLVEKLDSMTERHIVPGRVYTPSTLNSRDGLQHSISSILLAWVPVGGDDALLTGIKELAEREDLLPDQDHSLRSIVRQLGQIRLSLEQAPKEIARSATILMPDFNAGHAESQIFKIIVTATEIIEQERLMRLKERSIDGGKIENLRQYIESALLNAPPRFVFFTQVFIGRTRLNNSFVPKTISFNKLEKATLVSPTMDIPTANFEESLASDVQNFVELDVWESFKRRDRQKVSIPYKIEEGEFWREILPHVAKVGPDPVLVVSREAEARTLTRLIFSDSISHDLVVQIDKNRRSGARGLYVATIHGVDILGADFDAGVAWLFSARALEKIQYVVLDSKDRCVDVQAEFGDSIVGTLQVHVLPELHWANLPIFELNVLDPEDKR